jgi:hypothetical protein
VAKSDHTNIAVVESTWFQHKNTSVRGLFELIADIDCDNPHKYHYEMANSEAALKEAIPRIGSYRQCKYLYLAMHGDEAGLQLANNERLSRAELRNLLKKIKAQHGSTLSGIYLGSCLFGTQKLAEFIFAEEVGINWIAGYFEEVSWIKSSALDLLFFNELISEQDTSEIARINRTTGDLLDTAPGLVEKLGFGVFTRKRGGGIKNLLAPAYKVGQEEVDELA